MFNSAAGLSSALLAALVVLVSPQTSRAEAPGADVPVKAPALVAHSPVPAPPTTRSIVPVKSFAAEMPTQQSAGFRMEGAPIVEVVFGDISLYKRHIDTYLNLHAQMETTHARFSKATHRVQRALALKRKSKGCPVDEIAKNYAQTSESGLDFRRLGAELEESYMAIRELDALGESAGLTPDYRWHVRNSKQVYQRALTDLREMRATFKSQVDAEVRARGCQGEALLARAQELAEQDTIVVSSTELAPSESPIVASSTATFFISNERCSDSLRVFVDDTLLGEVKPDSRAAFQSLAGRHTICILASDESKSCGDSETLRSAFVHNGFAMSRSCVAAAAEP